MAYGSGWAIGSLVRFLPPKGRVFIGVCMLVVLAAVAIWFLAYSQTLGFRLQERGRLAEATIVAVSQNQYNISIAQGISIPNPAAAKVEYRTPSGEVTDGVNLSQSLPDNFGLVVGGQIQVVYDPEHPAQCLPADDVSSPGSARNAIPEFWASWAGFTALVSLGLILNLRKVRQERNGF